MNESSTPKIKKRVWSIIGYPSSLPADWLQVLTETGLKVAISPLHDKDIKVLQQDFEEDSENTSGIYKKPHYHIMLIWENPTTYNNVLELALKINSKIIKPVESPVGMFWYHIHRYERDPNKPMYDNKDRILLNGCSEDDFIDLDDDDKFTLKEIMTDMIERYNIIDFLQLKRMIQKKYFDEEGEEIETDSGFTYKQVMNFAYNNTYLLKIYMDAVYRKITKAKDLENIEKIEKLARELSKKELEEEAWKKSF